MLSEPLFFATIEPGSRLLLEHFRSAQWNWNRFNDPEELKRLGSMQQLANETFRFITLKTSSEWSTIIPRPTTTFNPLFSGQLEVIRMMSHEFLHHLGDLFIFNFLYIFLKIPPTFMVPRASAVIRVACVRPRGLALNAPPPPFPTHLHPFRKAWSHGALLRAGLLEFLSATRLQRNT